MKTIKVKLDEKTIEVTKLPIGRYAELLKSLKELPKHISGLSGQTSDQILEKLPQLISESLPDVVRVLTVATTLTEDEINSLGLDEIVEIVLAIVEVNNFKAMYEKVKKAMAQSKQ